MNISLLIWSTDTITTNIFTMLLIKIFHKTLLLQNKCLQGTPKMSGKPLGNNHQRCTCICGSLLSEALLDFWLTFTSHQHREQLCKEGEPKLHNNQPPGQHKILYRTRCFYPTVIHGLKDHYVLWLRKMHWSSWCWMSAKVVALELQ